MDTLQFEAIKVALKQDKEGYVLTLRVHPDEVPEALLRDFVGARYQVVMVRLGDDEAPIRRENFSEVVKLAGMLCRSVEFREFLLESHLVSCDSEDEVAQWMRETFSIHSRSEFAHNNEAASHLKQLNMEFQEWKRN